MGEYRLGKNGAGRRHFHHLAAIHHSHVIGHLGDNAQVMGDEQDGGAVLLFKLVHQLQYLRLDGHVQRRGGLVRDQQLGLAGQRHGDHHALPHAAGQLMGILLGHGLGVGYLDVLQHLDHLFPGLIFIHALMDHEGLGHLLFHREHRVQAGHGLLENHRNIVAADLIHIGAAQLGQLPPVKHDAAGFNVAVAVQQLQDAHGGHALARARFTHNAQGTAGFHAVAHAVHGLYGTALGGKEGMQILKFK